MPLTLSTDLTKKQETFSAGALRKSYNKPFNLDPSYESQENFKGISFSLVLSKLTDDASESVLEEYIQSLIKQIPISRNVIQNEAIRGIFLCRSVANFQYLQEVGTSALPSVHLLPLHSFPYEVKECLDRLSLAQESESVLSEISDSVAEWLMDAPKEYHMVFAAYLQSMPLISSRILMASLSDAEFSTNSENLIYSVSLFLKSDDKRLAQTAATFLITCGGIIGKNFLHEVLSTQELPHSKLIQGINKLLS